MGKDALDIGQATWADALNCQGVFVVLAEHGSMPSPPGPELFLPESHDEGCSHSTERATETVRKWRAARSPEKVEADNERERLRRKAARERMRAARASETPAEAEERRRRNRERMRAARAGREQIDAQAQPGSWAQRTVDEVIAELEAEAPGTMIDWLMRQRPE